MTTPTDEWHPERIPSWMTKRLLKVFPQIPVPSLALEQLARECGLVMYFQAGQARWGSIVDPENEVFAWLFKALGDPQADGIKQFAKRMRANFILTSGLYLAFPQDMACLCVVTFVPQERSHAKQTELLVN